MNVSNLIGYYKNKVMSHQLIFLLGYWLMFIHRFVFLFFSLKSFWLLINMNFLNDYILDSDEDEDIVQVLEYERRPYTVRERVDNFEKWDDQDFHARFRMTKETVLSILELIEDSLEFRTDRNNSIRPIDQLLLTLRFYATGKFLISSGDFCNVSKSSASKIIKKVSYAIASISQRYIQMPQGEQIGIAQREFYSIAKLPRIIGSIDCTHVGILSPGGPHAENFRNRKGFFSLNVQTVSSVNLKILDIVARWPGASHDQHVFDNSNLKARFENNEFGNALLVGDSGYANTRYLITPLINTHNEYEELYNESVCRTRNPVERQYGVWKRRFPVLALKLRLKLDTAMVVIIATAVLHNICIDKKEAAVPPVDPELNANEINFELDWDIEPNHDQHFVNARAQLLAGYIPGLLHRNNNQ